MADKANIIPDATPTENPDAEYVVYREPFMDGSIQSFREHRVLLSKWDAYAKEHGF